MIFCKMRCPVQPCKSLVTKNLQQASILIKILIFKFVYLKNKKVEYVLLHHAIDFIDVIPVYYVPEGFYEFRPLILIVKVVCMLPNI